jgi:hypothetical protein
MLDILVDGRAVDSIHLPPQGVAVLQSDTRNR